MIAAIAATEPGFHTALPSRDTTTPRQWLDTTRLREDTGFTPKYDTAAAAADYLAWLRAGNER